MEFLLKPIKGQESFYGKAIVRIEDNIFKLISYTTTVAEYNKKTNEMKINGYYSRTTMKHLNAFLVTCGFDKISKAELEKYLNNKNKN